jgi:hypothetical protein
MPDRRIRLNVRYSFEAVIDEASLLRRAQALVPANVDRAPNASEFDRAFAVWTDEVVGDARQNFKTGNSLAPDNSIDIQVSS